jgi:hypothetical protein
MEINKTRINVDVQRPEKLNKKPESDKEDIKPLVNDQVSLVKENNDRSGQANPSNKTSDDDKPRLITVFDLLEGFKSKKEIKELESSNYDVLPARNRAPVMIVHGTMEDKHSIMKYLDAAMKTGHPPEYINTYDTIKNGARIEESGQIVSEKLNEIRIQLAEYNLKELNLKKDTPKALNKFFHLDGNLYKEEDKSVEQISALLPGVIDEMNELMELDENVLLKSFSTRTKKIEDELTKKVIETDFRSDIRDKEEREEICGKIAAEIMDTIAPKSMMVGHSMGGFVSYVIAINPKEDINDDNPFHYDAGNGVSSAFILSSPIKKGVSSPLPKGLYNLNYDLMDKHVLTPMEKTPGHKIATQNPFYKMGYETNKALVKEGDKNFANWQTEVLTPFVYAKSPGYEQIAEGSSFIKEYVKDKPIPKGVSVISFTNKEDGISEQANSVADERYINAHNVDVDVQITPEDLAPYKKTRPNVAHQKMSEFPTEHWNEFKEEVLLDPKYIPRVLDRNNYDGLRWNCLQVIFNKVVEDKDFLKQDEYKPALRAIKSVANEKMPFMDSPSFIAQHLLYELEGKEKESCIFKADYPKDWIRSGNKDNN